MAKVTKGNETSKAVNTLSVQKSANPYRQIDLRAIEDTRLSHKAVGLLARLLIKPDGWEISIHNLVETYPDGKAAVKTAMRELRLAGYAHLVTVYDHATKKAVGKRWIISDMPDNPELRTLPKGLSKVDFKESRQTEKQTDRFSDRQESRPSGNHANKELTPKGSSFQEENTLTKTHTHKKENCENGKPVSAGVCDFEKNEEEEFKDDTSQLDVSLNSEEKKRKSSAKKKRKTAADVLAYCEQKGIALPELAEYTARNITQYVRGIAGSDKTEAGYYRKAIAHFPENPGLFRLISMWAQKRITTERAADLIPPADDATAWRIWFAGVWAGIEQYRDSYNANHPQAGKAVYTPPVQVRSY